MLACSTFNTASRKQQIESWEASEMNKEVVKLRPAERVNFPIDVHFHASCKNSELDEVKNLLLKGVDIDVANVDGLTVLHQSCIDNNYEVVKFLLSNNANVNAQDNEGWTPLHACASCSYIEIAKLLLEHGADTSIVSFDQELPLDVAQGEDMVALLKDWMQRQSVDEKAARSAEERKMLADAREWLKTGVYPRVVDPRTGATALHIAAAKGYADVLELLLKLPDVVVDATDIDGWTPLHAAAHWAKEKPLRLLAAAGASFDVITLTNQSIYDVADRSMTMLLRHLRVEQQRAAMAAANAAEANLEIRPPFIVATRRRAEDEEVQEISTKWATIENAKNEKEEDDVKLAAPKVPKTTNDDEDEQEAEEVKPVLKDEVALKAKHGDKSNKEKESDPSMEMEGMKTPEKLPSDSSSPQVDVPSGDSYEELRKKLQEQPSVATRKANELDDKSESITQMPSGTGTILEGSPFKTVSTSQNSQMPEVAVAVDKTALPISGAANRRISAVLAPARSEETEAQRSSKARLVRSTRRSTQGIANDVLEEARRLSLASTSTPANAISASTTSVVSPTSVQTEPKRATSPDTGELDQKPTSPTTTTHVSKTTIIPTQSSSLSNTSQTTAVAPSSIIAHSRARRAARDRVPTGLLNASDVLAAAKQLENNVSSDCAATAATHAVADPIPRPTTRLLRSAILNVPPTTSNSAIIKNDTMSNGGSGDRRTPAVTPPFAPTSSSPPSTLPSGKPADQRYNWRENLDFRLLYEEERSEKERLKRTLDQVNREVAALRSELARLRFSTSAPTAAPATAHVVGSVSNTDSSSAALQRRSVDFLEDQSKEIDKLRQENARMTDENKSLIRVISKLSSRTVS